VYEGRDDSVFIVQAASTILTTASELIDLLVDWLARWLARWLVGWLTID
jgi:hypothetical protein